jgi:nicotinate-nucleotide pyrophosphorylase (carboxylating)
MLDDWLRAALQEDLGTGDVTTEILVPSSLRGRAEVCAKEPFIVAGIDVALRTFVLLSKEVRAPSKVEDGQAVEAGSVLLELEGPVRALLGGERVALNIFQHLSGVATLTRKFVDAVAGTGAKILDTRKTLPGLIRGRPCQAYGDSRNTLFGPAGVSTTVPASQRGFW